ncbi:hypothetical protein FOZ63_010316 [Perkinsus olseni]|uniref:Uncharacterized protein n=1 Tax=Perkinsus olseni TaxID=32597 RepID=A0A7J6QGJ2_PEROL|nr:hypothetical protein FOZ63_010316 [Perkinsus olseni]
MYFNSVLLAALLGAVAGQGTVIRIRQTRLPFRNGSREDSVHSQLGTLRHIQTLQLDDADNPVDDTDFIWFTSIIAKEDGTGLLATSNGLFVVLDLSPSNDYEFDVAAVTMYPIRNPGGGIEEYDAVGLTINGPYRGGGGGDLIVSATDERQVLRFPDGIQSQQSADLNLEVIFPECSGAPGAILSSGNTVYAGSAYDGFVARPFSLEFGESDGGEPFIPTDTAELSNGDIMILFTKEDEDTMRIGYVTRDELRQAIFGKGTLRPEIIADLARRDGYNIGEQSGLAIREDRTSGRIFLYMVNDNYWGDEEYNLLSTFEWIPAGPLLGITTGQGTVVEIEQSRLPLRNNSQEKILRSSLGTLKHVQTLQLVGVGANSRNFGLLSSLAVTADGSQMLAVNGNGLFIDVKIKLISGGVFDVLGATTFPMRDPEGNIIPFNAHGLAVEGIYQGRGIGNFFVSSLADKQVYRFPNGIQSRQSVDLGLTDMLGDCRYDEGPEAILRPRDRREFSLLMFCPAAMSLAPTSTPRREVFIGFAYNELKNVAKRIHLEVGELLYLAVAASATAFTDIRLSAAPSSAQSSRHTGLRGLHII